MKRLPVEAFSEIVIPDHTGEDREVPIDLDLAEVQVAIVAGAPGHVTAPESPHRAAESARDQEIENEPAPAVAHAAKIEGSVAICLQMMSHHCQHTKFVFGGCFSSNASTCFCFN